MTPDWSPSTESACDTIVSSDKDPALSALASASPPLDVTETVASALTNVLFNTVTFGATSWGVADNSDDRFTDKRERSRTKIPLSPATFNTRRRNIREETTRQVGYSLMQELSRAATVAFMSNTVSSKVTDHVCVASTFTVSTFDSFTVVRLSMKAMN